MQPLPYLMHIIKTGVNDADLLAGDILTDADLQQALPFRDGEYYIQTAKQELPLAYKNNQYDALEFENNFNMFVLKNNDN
jgi:hypothetical protein